MIDTLSYLRRLESVGISREQAEGQIDVMTDIIYKNLATKQDLKDHSIVTDQNFKDFTLVTEQRFKEFTAVIEQRFKDFTLEIDQRFKDFTLMTEQNFKDLEHRFTIKLGAAMAAGVGILATLMTVLKFL